MRHSPSRFPAAAVTVLGTNAPETIYGTARGDTIDARAGDDRIFAFAGRDVVRGGAGSDRIDLGIGNDVVRARDGRPDSIMCGPGRDIAIVDARDSVRGCETVLRPTVPPPPRLRPPRCAREPEAGHPWVGNGRRRSGPRDRGLHRAQRSPWRDDRLPRVRRAAGVLPHPRLQNRVVRRRGRGWSPACPAARRARGPRRARCRPRRGVGLSMPAGPPARASASRDWVSGYYLVHYLLTSGPYSGNSSVSWLLLREPDGAPLLVQAGASLAGLQRLGRRQPVPVQQSRWQPRCQVAFDRPVDRHALMRAFEWDAPLVMFLERSGYDLAYQADLDTARDPATLQGRMRSSSPGTTSTGRRRSATASIAPARPARASRSSAPTRRTGRCATKRTSAPRGLQGARPGIPRPTRSSRPISSARSCRHVTSAA